ncbi:site-specific integrase [Bacillus pumilus]|uniref:site-specific integrase n=1 Tax=Bacillus pumilus TaxID=1408 RepID=UPI00017A644C|nr:tyrosine-type recombinase/integrase [Bacillus pumilus]EDW20508.1 DNA integration/recombination [Bacillus pumilus ATCC 7061]MCR4353399.1 site-specific integrase [Bacillus pumilus]MCY7505164.1 site-specific integrase [Bacillus pumilus]MDR4269472.1 site-specific integrase [Bacillus pumilus]MED4725691.1 tyrosine-type recombinase/integrase [Bacillus pumilus]
MVSFRQRGKDWEYRIPYYDPVTQKRREKSKKGFRTKKEAATEAAIVQAEINGDFVRKDDNITISSYIDLWFEKYKLTVKKSSWDSRYDSIIVIKKNLGSCRVKDVTEKTYEGFLNKIAPEYAKNTLTNIHQVFNMMIREAVRDSYFKDNPIHAVNLPKKAKEKKVEELDEDLKDMKFWEKEEIKLFLQVVSRKGRPRDLAMFLLLIYSGLRIGEAVALTWDKVDFKKSEIKVRYTLFREKDLKSNYELLSPKTESSIRNVPVPPQVIMQLRILKNVQEQVKNDVGELYKDEDFVFADNSGMPEPARNFNYRMATYIKKAGVTKITPHNLRHTYASLLFAAGIDLKEAQRRLGHSSSKTTLDAV